MDLTITIGLIRNQQIKVLTCLQRLCHLLQPQKGQVAPAQLVGEAATNNTVCSLVQRWYTAHSGLLGLIDCMLGTRVRREWQGSGESDSQNSGFESVQSYVCFQSHWCFSTLLFTLCVGRRIPKTSECYASPTLLSVLRPTAKPAGPSGSFSGLYLMAAVLPGKRTDQETPLSLALGYLY